MYFYGPPQMAEQKQDDQLEQTYSSSVRIRDVALKTCQRRWTIGRSGERGSGISALAAQHDDDDTVYSFFVLLLLLLFFFPKFRQNQFGHIFGSRRWRRNFLKLRDKDTKNRVSGEEDWKVDVLFAFPLSFSFFPLSFSFFPLSFSFFPLSFSFWIWFPHSRAVHFQNNVCSRLELISSGRFTIFKVRSDSLGLFLLLLFNC